MNITIITSENRRLYPANVYNAQDKNLNNLIEDIEEIYSMLYQNKKILIISSQFDQYGNSIKNFNGELGKEDIKSIFLSKDVQDDNNLKSVLTLTEAAKKWNLASGSTIRKAIERGKFKETEIKQSGNVWLTTYSAMQRVFGELDNDKNTCIIYDEFESLYITKEYWLYADSHYLKEPFYLNAKEKEREIRYNYIKDICAKILKIIKMNKRVFIKNKYNNEIKQIIENKEQLYSYIRYFTNRNILNEEDTGSLIKELKNKD